MTCHISGILYAPDETPLPETKVVVVPADGIVASDGGAIMPDILRFETNNAGLLEMDLAPGRYHLYWIGAESKGRTPLAVPDEASADLSDLFFEADVPIRGSRGPAGKGWDRVYYDPATDDLVFESDEYPELDYRTPALAGPRQAAQDWAEGDEPGGPGTDSAKGWAGEAENIKETLLSEITAEADTLPPGSSATATYDGQSKKLTLGIPEGQAGSIGNAVRWDQQQSLTGPQQQQARDNIGLRKLAAKDKASLVDDTEGTLPLNRGGTNATTAAAARTQLGVGTAGTRADSYFVQKGGDTGIGGYSATSKNLGNLSGTVTLAPSESNIQHANNNGAATITAPTAGGVYTIIVEITNTGSAGALTLTGFDDVDGDDLTTDNGDKFLLYVTKTNNSKTAIVKALQ